MQRYKNNKYIEVHIENEFELLVGLFNSDIQSVMEKLIDIIDFSDYENELNYGKEYILTEILLTPKNEIFEIELGWAEFALKYLFEDKFKPIAKILYDLMVDMENKCTNMFNNYILKEECDIM